MRLKKSQNNQGRIIKPQQSPCPTQQSDNGSTAISYSTQVRPTPRCQRASRRTKKGQEEQSPACDLQPGSPLKDWSLAERSTHLELGEAFSLWEGVAECCACTSCGTEMDLA